MSGLAGRRLWVGIPGPELSDDVRRHLDDVRPGGVILFRRNVRSAEQVTRLTSDLRALLGPDLHVAADQEGGLVVRFEDILTTFPGNMALGAASVREPSLGEHLAREQGRLGARELRALGVTVNLAPCCDLATRADNPGLGVRAFSAWPKLAGRLAAAMVRGHAEGGVLATLKHFPGLGNATVDSHLDLPVVTGGIDDALVPFADGLHAGARLVMTTHVQFADLDDVPATFSRVVVEDVLRGRLGFTGCTMTDDLEMGAMTRRFSFDDVVRRASAAGHDILAICHDPAAQRRARDLLRDDGTDSDAIAARLDALRPLPAVPGGAPSAAEAAGLADAIAGRAVTVVRDDRGLLPLRAGEPALVIATVARAETQVEDPLRGETLAVLLDAFQAPSRVLRVAPGADLVRAVADHPGAIIVALRNPFDLDVIPATTPATLVTAYGFRPVHLRALVRVMRGEVAPYGRLPF